jgi:hypothetical protein
MLTHIPKGGEIINLLRGSGNYKELASRLKGRKVTLMHLKVTKKFLSFSHKGANEEYFDWEGRRISVAQFFSEKYGMKLKFPKELCVNVGTERKPILVPSELVIRTFKISSTYFIFKYFKNIRFDFLNV